MKKSLERLRLDCIDVFRRHRFDPNTPIEETMQALHDAMKAQCARYIGMSSYYSWQCKCLATRQSACDQLTDRWIEWRVSNRRMIPEHVADEAIANDLTPFISMQNHHSLVYREEERETFPTLNHFGVGIISWSPLARGLLTRPLKTDAVTTRGNTGLCVSECSLYTFS